MSDENNKAPAAVGEPEVDKLMRVVGELEKIDSALPMNWHRSYFEDSPNYRNWTEEEKHNAHVSERRLIRAGGRVGESSCNAIACVQTDDRDLIDRIVAVRNHLPTLLSAIRRLTAANAELVKERDKRERLIHELLQAVNESHDVMGNLDAELSAAREEAKRLREALKFYGNVENYQWVKTPKNHRPVNNDCGEIARAALAAPAGGQQEGTL